MPLFDLPAGYLTERGNVSEIVVRFRDGVDADAAEAQIGAILARLSRLGFVVALVLLIVCAISLCVVPQSVVAFE